MHLKKQGIIFMIVKCGAFFLYLNEQKCRNRRRNDKNIYK